MRRLPKSGVVWALVLSAAIAGCVVWATKAWTNDALKQPGPDGTALIGTFITLYALFLGGFGALAGLVGKSSHLRLRVIAFVFLAGAAMLDLVRILNSTEDLYQTTIKKLTYFELNDNMHDFQIYFIVNFGVSAFALLVAGLPRSGTTTSPSS